jgi:hypothetical protein
VTDRRNDDDSIDAPIDAPIDASVDASFAPQSGGIGNVGYPEHPPRFERPGRFEAWLVAVDDPIKRSGMSWEMTEPGQTIVVAEDTKVNKSRESGEQRGYLWGAVDILESLYTGSTITIHCTNTYLVGAVDGLLDAWAAKNFKGRAHKEILQRILKVRDERKLTIEGKYWPTGDNPYVHIFDRLLKRARDAVAKRQ